MNIKSRYLSSEKNCPVRIQRIAQFGAIAALLTLSLSSFSQEPVDDEKFEAPTIEVHTLPEYPDQAIRDNVEGWVHIHCMVNTDCRAYDFVTVDSSGYKPFEAAAIKALKQTQFVPGKKNGIPVNARYISVLGFTIHGTGQGPSPKFFERYQQVQELISNHEKLASERMIRRLYQTSKTR